MSNLITVGGLVIARREIGDSSAYIDVLTGEYGVIEILVRGAKKISGSNLSAAALFTYSDFCVSRRSRAGSGDIRYTLNSAKIRYGFHKLSADIAALSLAAYFAEAVRYTSAPEQNILRLMMIALYELCECRRPFTFIKAAFELRLCAEIGLAPNLIACAECACYESGMYFDITEGLIHCSDCYDESLEKGEKGEVFMLLPEVLRLARHTLYSPLDRIFKTEVSENAPREFSVIAEEYLLYHLGRGFKTLDYYRRLP